MKKKISESNKKFNQASMANVSLGAYKIFNWVKTLVRYSEALHSLEEMDADIRLVESRI